MYWFDLDFHGISIRAVNHNAIVIDEQFNQTLDEVLEMKGITREDIPREILDHFVTNKIL